MRHITATMASDQLGRAREGRRNWKDHKQTTSMDDKKRLVTHHETRWSMGVEFRSGGGVSVSAEVKIIGHRLGGERRISISTGSATNTDCMETSGMSCA